jgi:hypothetical protein
MCAAADVVGTYLRYLADHSIEEALACLAPDFALEFAGAGFSMTKDQAATALGWDAGANGRLEWEVADETPPTVTIQGSEGNDFLDLIGIGRLAFRSVFTVSITGLISHQSHGVSWGDVALPEAMAPLIAWASEYESQELAEIYPKQQMSYSQPMAIRWVRLAKKWKAEATSQS